MPDFRLRNQDGRTIHLGQFRGKDLLITFIYTRCPLPNFCPLVTHNFAVIDKQLVANPALYAKAHLLCVSFDPEHDTPERLRAYGAKYIGSDAKTAFADWDFAVPEKPVLEMAKYFDVGITNGPDETITHTLSTTLIGPDGKVVRFYPGNEWTPEQVLTDVKQSRSVKSHSGQFRIWASRYLRRGVSKSMSDGLKIRKDGELDFLSLGALVHRLDPGIIPFRKATECRIHVSGGEFNVAANLSDCFGMKTAIVSAMSDYPIGDLIAERVRAMGVKPIYKHFKHDGVTGPNMATVYSDRGFGVRGPVVFYNRCNEAAAQLKPGDFDWKAIFAGGVRWVHCGGIFAALSPTTAELAAEMMREAKAAGAVTSFDLNFREKLWKIHGGDKRAVETHRHHR